MSVRRVMIEVEMANGALLRQVVLNPSPGGDNPMFLEQQVDQGVQDASHMITLAIRGAYGPQRLADDTVTR